MSAHSPANGQTDRFGLVGSVLADKFAIEHYIAEGGFGVVYAARHLTLDVSVALKVLKAPRELNETAKRSFVDNFILEAKTIARIKHPNIVQVLDTGVATMPNSEYAPWMALEWLDGTTLTHDLSRRRGRPRSPAETFALMRPILDAIAYAHEDGIAHRDIKPGNIMLCETRRGLVPRVLDFGIAKLVPEGETAGSGATRTQGSVQAFSPHYAAPEQISRTRTGPWTDVHALGLVLTELLVGRPPYTGADLTDLFREVLGDPRPTPAKFGVNVGAWEDVLRRAVAYKPEHRFANAGELMAALEATLSSVSSSTFINANPGNSPQTYSNAVTGPMQFPGSNTGPQSGPHPGGAASHSASGPYGYAAPSGPHPDSTTGNTGVPLTVTPGGAPRNGKGGLIVGVVGIAIVGIGLGVGVALGGRPAAPASHPVAIASPVTPPVPEPANPVAPPTPVATTPNPPVNIQANSAPAPVADPVAAQPTEPTTAATVDAGTEATANGNATGTSRSSRSSSGTRSRSRTRVPDMW